LLHRRHHDAVEQRKLRTGVLSVSSAVPAARNISAADLKRAAGMKQRLMELISPKAAISRIARCWLRLRPHAASSVATTDRPSSALARALLHRAPRGRPLDKSLQAP
jgi:hypothetical protein